MSEQKHKLPSAMVEAVRPIAERMSESSLTPGYDGGCSGLSEDEAMGWLEAALQAAGVPALLARIAELEATLRDRICEGCDRLMANVGLLHLCGCEDQQNLCSACKAECACAGGRE